MGNFYHRLAAPNKWQNHMEYAEVYCEGDSAGTFPEAQAMYDTIMPHIELYDKKARHYPAAYNMTLDMNTPCWEMSEISFGHVTFVEGHSAEGFSILYIYKQPGVEANYWYHIKVKFKSNGWPIGFEGGPL